MENIDIHLLFGVANSEQDRLLGYIDFNKSP